MSKIIRILENIVYFIYDQPYSFWWLNIARKPNVWDDALQDGCRNKPFCRTCGRGRWFKIKEKKK